jgi:hypothetical protein
MGDLRLSIPRRDVFIVHLYFFCFFFLISTLSVYTVPSLRIGNPYSSFVLDMYLYTIKIMSHLVSCDPLSSLNFPFFTWKIGLLLRRKVYIKLIDIMRRD